MTVRQQSELLERSHQRDVLDSALADVLASGRGRMVLLGGEAGVGKTALLREFSAGQSGRVLWGGCDPLFTPRPLGPLFEVAEAAGGELEQLVASEAKPHEVAAALVAELAAPKGTVLVLEDLHWADEATLDVLRLLARQVEKAPALVLASYRDDELERSHPLRVVLGELATSPAVARLPLDPLSRDAVAQLAEPHEVDPDDLYGRTAGNPFYVSEVLAAGGGEIPATVRDAVLARALRLDPEARALLEAVAVVPPQAELWLLEELAAAGTGRLEDCLQSGMLDTAQGGVAFRHELARLAVEQSLTPDRALELHRQALAALAAPPGGVPDMARLAHHAEAAGDHAAVLRFAPEAAVRAASLGAHREAAAQYQRTLRFADAEPPATKAELLELCATELYLSGQVGEAVPLGERALAYRREAGDKLREGDSLRALSHLLSFVGRPEEGERACREAITLLEQLEPGPELAFAYGTLAQRRLNWEDTESALHWGARAHDLAERFGEQPIAVHALITMAGAEARDHTEQGREKLERALEIAREAGLEDHAGRVFLNLAWLMLRRRRYDRASTYLEAGFDYCGERGLDYWRLCMLAARAWIELARGQWTEASESARAVLRDPREPRVARVLALAAQGLVRARRGDPDVWAALDAALALAEPTKEIQQLTPVAAARAEAAWLEGRPYSAETLCEETLELTLGRGATWDAAELARWHRRLGGELGADPAGFPPPYDAELAGDAERAASGWDDLGCPYDAALALADSADPDHLRQALGELQRLEARPAAAIVARRLREQGARGVPRGPRKATRANEANLTPRELEVLELVSEGLRNSDIAERLFLSEKTVDHHVSAILRKLDARTRGEASAKALRLGLTDQDR
jgi:DNA-binding CsgD family transcriptional regulator/tetratricopeptide (TPR) repeat protein